MNKIHIRTDKRANRKIKLTDVCRMLIFAGMLQLMGGCVKDDLHNTPHPDKGAVKVTTDWTGRSSDAAVPVGYILRIGTEEQTVSGETNAFKGLFAPGKQDLLVYHQADGITISGTTATVNTRPGGTLEPNPEHLFSGAKELDIVPDDTLKVTVPMQQYTRQLTLVLKLNPGDEQRVRKTTATLTGIASAINLTTGTWTEAAGKTVVPDFAPGTSDGQPILSATMRLLGVITGERQILTLSVTLTDGYVQPITKDLTEALKSFDTGSKEPLTLDAMLELPTAAGMGGTITDWNVVDNGNIEVH